MYPVFKKMYHDTRRKLFLWRLLTGKYKGTYKKTFRNG